MPGVDGRDLVTELREPMERISRELIRKETLRNAELDQLIMNPAAGAAR